MWVKGELHFASLFSYRIPGTSPSWSPASPVPSPAAFRLALVDAAIQKTLSTDYGQDIFDLVRHAPLKVVPPEWLTIVKAVVRRLKPAKPAKQEDRPHERPPGTRESCHLLGPLTVYLKPDGRQTEVAELWRWVRRLGTTDSLATASASLNEQGPPAKLCWQESMSLPLKMENFRRFVVSLVDVGNSSFDQVNPYTPSWPRYEWKTYVLPLVLAERGENWMRYRRQAFEL